MAHYLLEYHHRDEKRIHSVSRKKVFPMYPSELLQKAERLTHTIENRTEEMRRRTRDLNTRSLNGKLRVFPDGNLSPLFDCESLTTQAKMGKF